MNVAVLIAGICDPKWPLDAAQPRILSPFDESALEVALKLRDRDPGVTVGAMVLGAAADEPLARAVLSHRPDRLLKIEVPDGSGWDLRAHAALLQEALRAWGEMPDLILIGREFGDRDDGAVPACLAAMLGWPYVALIREGAIAEGSFVAIRERAGFEERIGYGVPLVASVTNDRVNRLRHPLFKNVMNAKRAPIDSRRFGEPASRVSLLASQPAAAPVRDSRCRMLEGPPEAQAEQLAAWLREWRQPA